MNMDKIFQTMEDSLRKELETLRADHPDPDPDSMIAEFIRITEQDLESVKQLRATGV